MPILRKETSIMITFYLMSGNVQHTWRKIRRSNPGDEQQKQRNGILNQRYKGNLYWTKL